MFEKLYETGLGVCSTALQFTDDDAGWDRANTAFEKVDEAAGWEHHLAEAKKQVEEMDAERAARFDDVPTEVVPF